MREINFDFLTDGKKHYLALVGAGGKTTLMYELAELYAKQGKRAVALTSTHILVPEPKELWTRDKAELKALWQRGTYAVLGEPEESSGKLIAPPRELYQWALAKADVLLCEADGAKHKPLKAPRKHEPVIPEACDIVIGVAGLDGLGQSWRESCFGWQEAVPYLGISPEERVKADKLAQLLLAPWGTRKAVGTRVFYLVLNKLDVVADRQEAERLRQLLLEGGMAAARVCMRGKPRRM